MPVRVTGAGEPSAVCVIDADVSSRTGKHGLPISVNGRSSPGWDGIPKNDRGQTKHAQAIAADVRSRGRERRAGDAADTTAAGNTDAGGCPGATRSKHHSAVGIPAFLPAGRHSPSKSGVEK